MLGFLNKKMLTNDNLFDERHAGENANLCQGVGYFSDAIKGWFRYQYARARLGAQ